MFITECELQAKDSTHSLQQACRLPCVAILARASQLAPVPHVVEIHRLYSQMTWPDTSSTMAKVRDSVSSSPWPESTSHPASDHREQVTVQRLLRERSALASVKTILNRLTWFWTPAEVLSRECPTEQPAAVSSNIFRRAVHHVAIRVVREVAVKPLHHQLAWQLVFDLLCENDISGVCEVDEDPHSTRHRVEEQFCSRQQSECASLEFQ